MPEIWRQSMRRRPDPANPEALTAIAQRNGGSEAVVALATALRQAGRLAGLEVSVKRYRSGRLSTRKANSFDANPGESDADFLKRAADAVAADIESGAKDPRAPTSRRALRSTVPHHQPRRMAAGAQPAAAVSSIRKIDLLSLSRQEARIELKYVGSQDQLKSSLAAVNLDLGGGAPVWRIQPSGAASAQ